MVMTDRQVNALAAFISEGRPDFQNPGVVAALRAHRDRYDPWQLAAAMIRRASDPEQRTPQLQPFDFDRPVVCRVHPSAGVRTDGTCGYCWADANAASGPLPLRRRGTPPTAEQRSTIREAIGPAPAVGEPPALDAERRAEVAAHLANHPGREGSVEALTTAAPDGWSQQNPGSEEETA